MGQDFHLTLVLGRGIMGILICTQETGSVFFISEFDVFTTVRREIGLYFDDEGQWEWRIG